MTSGSPTLLDGPRTSRTFRDRWNDTLRARAVELARFGSVGSVAFVVDMGTYNLLRFGPVALFSEKPITARIVAVVISTLVSWLGSRYWTFADQRSARQGREFALFGAINVVGIAITVGALAFSHYVLGLSGPWSDNIANIIGIVLGTIVRYLGYKAFVFTGTATLPTQLAEIGQQSAEPQVVEVIGITPAQVTEDVRQATAD
ncbi:GtrA family protein [Cellulomonas sp. RIT-PI-Y]|jgi:putative flippase GtrA|uniref:GtrA family protein n=1 Tax=Cellulomonas sp. RIT-PI-Y TaxID=3035297 RepID=UPI0021DAF1EA|nr:GtrA family protein [Cellulomonas sp. RIT-PI-Y]